MNQLQDYYTNQFNYRWIIGGNNVKIRNSDLREREWYAIHDKTVLYLAEIHGFSKEDTRNQVSYTILGFKK